MHIWLNLLLFFFAVDHKAYVYSLGVCEVNQRCTSCPGSPYFIDSVEEITKLGLSPWWRAEGQKSKIQKWPEKPRKLMYEYSKNVPMF